LSEITRIFKAGKGIKNLLDLLDKTPGDIHIPGAIGSACALITAIAFDHSKKQVLAVLPEKEEAAYFYNDLITICGQENTLFFPSTYRRSAQYDQVEPSNIVLRTEVLNKTGSSGNPLIIVTYPEALVEKVIDRNDLLKNTLILREKEEISPEFLHEILDEYEFERVDFVYEPGQYSVRGSIIDVFSFAGDQPYRIDFAGNKVDSMRTFEIETQMSIARLPEISIIPDTQKKLKDEKKVSFFNFIQKDTILFIKNPDYIIARIEEIADRVKETEDEFLAASVIRSGDIQPAFSEFRVVEFSGVRRFQGNAEVALNISRQPSFSKNFDLLADDLKQRSKENYQVFLLSENERQIERLHDIFSDKEEEVSYIPILKTLHEGFIDHDLKICCYTDHQIFDRYHRFQLKDGFGRKAAVTINELNSLQPGDYIVHIDHGIGIFGGLEKIEVNGKIQEAIKLVYKDLDTLFVNIHSLHKISKYKGKEGEVPKIYKLGSGAWQKLKQSTKSKVRDIARELIILYAKRKKQTGFGFSPDSYLNHELEASFIYEDTPDQVKATSSVWEDMESDSPMDRLICGDVGFGKTEIAVRAAFKAVCDSKQVAILVPTTILALQHYNTFTERLKGFPCTVDYFTRLRPSKKQTEILKGLSDGSIDIIIGTHKLVSKNVQFKDIGLLIIDEEQKFGVAVKEKLKQIRVNVDTLTLTATPIPRTLQFSLMGAR
ncbi:MAG: DEAD/DEAH box helicase, partial [Bacteroidetes bacterium]|nr:DEAD/DEAH box helicase [Bacteroidota bacterium]